MASNIVGSPRKVLAVPVGSSLASSAVSQTPPSVIVPDDGSNVAAAVGPSLGKSSVSVLHSIPLFSSEVVPVKSAVGSVKSVRRNIKSVAHKPSSKSLPPRRVTRSQSSTPVRVSSSPSPSIPSQPSSSKGSSKKRSLDPESLLPRKKLTQPSTSHSPSPSVQHKKSGSFMGYKKPHSSPVVKKKKASLPKSPSPSVSAPPSGSSDLPPLMFFFNTRKFQKYKDRTSFRLLNVESHVVLDDFPRFKKSMLSRGWINSVSNLLMPSQILVREIYSNIDKHILESSNPNQFKVFCRGKWFRFSPSTIAKVLNFPVVKSPVFCSDFSSDLNLVAAKLTGTLDFKWPDSKGAIPATALTSFYRLLFQVALTNWLPNTHKYTVGTSLARFMFAVGTGVSIDLSTLIFDRIYNEAVARGTRSFLPFPCLLHRLALSISPEFTAQEVFLSVPEIDSNLRSLKVPQVFPSTDPASDHVLPGFPTSGWRFMLFDYMHQFQASFNDFVTTYKKDRQRTLQFERRVLAQLAQIRASSQGESIVPSASVQGESPDRPSSQ
ncbi:uncharacterized protein LOC133815676 [Humulus lupulus]|uniref:uncharacterized protein LOC133815676 n=1 Tax=Humulus lupulus TaxID=3486 RepID=UPI002B4077F8|nr:uncharacterized protein LOC133815676 [Humulus lupulus]